MRRVLAAAQPPCALLSRRRFVAGGALAAAGGGPLAGCVARAASPGAASPQTAPSGLPASLVRAAPGVTRIPAGDATVYAISDGSTTRRRLLEQAAAESWLVAGHHLPYLAAVRIVRCGAGCDFMPADA